MKKLVLGFAIVATTALSSSAFAWVCTAQATDGSGAWGQWISPYLNVAQVGALNACRQYSPFCVITQCY